MSAFVLVLAGSSLYLMALVSALSSWCWRSCSLGPFVVVLDGIGILAGLDPFAVVCDGICVGVRAGLGPVVIVLDGVCVRAALACCSFDLLVFVLVVGGIGAVLVLASCSFDLLAFHGVGLFVLVVNGVGTRGVFACSSFDAVGICAGVGIVCWRVVHLTCWHFSMLACSCGQWHRCRRRHQSRCSSMAFVLVSAHLFLYLMVPVLCWCWHVCCLFGVGLFMLVVNGIGVVVGTQYNCSI